MVVLLYEVPIEVNREKLLVILFNFPLLFKELSLATLEADQCEAESTRVRVGMPIVCCFLHHRHQPALLTIERRVSGARGNEPRCGDVISRHETHEHEVNARRERFRDEEGARDVDIIHVKSRPDMLHPPFL